MKKLLIIFIILLSKNAYCSVDTIQVKSKITDVTVFFNGAQVTRQVNLKINKGQFLLLVDKLPQELNPRSIQINAAKNCKILSVKHQLNHENENKKSSEETIIENKIESQELTIKEIKNKLNVFDIEEKLLLDNSMLGKKDEGSSIATLKEAADFYRSRINEIRQRKLSLNTELNTSNKNIQDYYVQLNELTAKKRKTYSQVLITMECNKEMNDTLKLSYYISSAGWEPLYDFRVEDISKPFIMVYNANVYQSSGENWENINIKLSSSNPSLSGDKPKLMTWYLGRRNPYQFNPNIIDTRGQSILKGSLHDWETNEALPFASVAVYDENNQIGATSSDIDGQYSIKPVPSGYHNLSSSYKCNFI